MSQKVAVIGAGLSGLTTAYYLRKRGNDVQVFEKAGRIGGVIETREEDGFLYENGPSTGVLGQPEAAALIEELGEACQLEIADEDAKYRWIWKGDRWHAIPSGLWGGITTPLFSWYDKFRILGEPFRKPGTNPNESLADLVLRRMGKSFLKYAIDPFILGVYSGDPSKLIVKYALPKLYNLEQNYGSFIGGAIKKSKEPKTDWDKKATKEVFSLRGGLKSLVNALGEQIGADRFHLNQKNLTVEYSEGKYQITDAAGQTFEFDKLISTVGGYALRQLFPFLPADKLAQIEAMKYARVVQVSVGFKKWEGMPIKAFGGLIPFHENRDILGVLFLSSFLKGRAPEGGALLSTFLGGVRKPKMVDLPDDEIKALVEKELKSMLGLTKWQPDLLVINRYQHAIPQYGIESAGRLQAIAELEAEFPGLLLGGNIRDGIGMADRIKQGRNLADSVTD
ncbi:protoporphyrinogen oxidase [Sunxiuqinia dokdonensis]|uniref:Coproporphyrinogen III oxidase n=1 Tax=Sunxiuqinia dokdonensis TaxID=1409788 RepID=A0A0L8VB44_9BACT|nr:protoporphyrinogen oxidase [Sunxiuqinia dokdonensis]KOH45685.1 protoporphyrinogen oxidase [Sunxiuqinia dokdonensis]